MNRSIYILGMLVGAFAIGTSALAEEYSSLDSTEYFFEASGPVIPESQAIISESIADDSMAAQGGQDISLPAQTTFAPLTTAFTDEPAAAEHTYRVDTDLGERASELGGAAGKAEVALPVSESSDSAKIENQSSLDTVWSEPIEGQRELNQGKSVKVLFEGEVETLEAFTQI